MKLIIVVLALFAPGTFGLGNVTIQIMTNVQSSFSNMNMFIDSVFMDISSQSQSFDQLKTLKVDAGVLNYVTVVRQNYAPWLKGISDYYSATKANVTKNVTLSSSIVQNGFQNLVNDGETQITNILTSKKCSATAISNFFSQRYSQNFTNMASQFSMVSSLFTGLIPTMPITGFATQISTAMSSSSSMGSTAGALEAVKLAEFVCMGSTTAMLKNSCDYAKWFIQGTIASLVQSTLFNTKMTVTAAIADAATYKC